MLFFKYLLWFQLDEYHPVDPQELCRLTENSFDASKVRLMEQKVLTIINFEAYGTEPMTFIRRYLKAAQFWDDTIIYELSILFMDAMVLTLWEDAKDASTAKKASISCPGFNLISSVVLILMRIFLNIYQVFLATLLNNLQTFFLLFCE